MLKQKDAAYFIHAMIKKDDENKKCKNWEVLHCWDKPPGVKNILAICDFRRKRFPNGHINKHKARLFPHDGMQQYGFNYWETHSPK